MHKVALILFLFSILCSSQSMNNQKLGEILVKEADSIHGTDGYWQIKKEDVILICVTDEPNNRMRIISPIVDVDKLENEILVNALKANYHTALDVKYAISDNILWSVYIHPLKELTEHQITDAISQVYYANLTFGFTYSSTNLFFGAPESNNDPDKNKKKSKTKKI